MNFTVKILASLTPAAVCCALLACDQVKKVARQAGSAVTRELRAKVGVGEVVKVDRSLEQLVDQNDDGYLFRKDLPFPPRISVKARFERDISGRVFQTTELGRKVENVKGLEVIVSQLDSEGNEVRYALHESSFSVPSMEKSGSGSETLKLANNPLRPVALSTEPVTFRKVGGSWKSAGTPGFRSMMIAQQLAPVFDDLLVDYALVPRPLWFSSQKRLRIGDELDVSNSSISMLVAGQATGKLSLKFESVEPVNGHPCGVFRVIGDFRRKGFPSFDGQLNDEDITIESGRMWLSLIYPIILRQELRTIYTFKPTGDSGPAGSGQGSVNYSVVYDWVADDSKQ